MKNFKRLYFVAALVLLAPLTAGAVSILQPYQGGTGTSSTPSLGSLLLGNNSSTYTVLGLGANGTCLVASSTQPSGVAWLSCSGSAGITSVNGQAGPAITIAAGSNITVSTSTNTITIASTGGGGSGTVTSVTSANGAATVANTTTTPVITIVSAPILTTARTINGTSFNGSANITVTADASTLTGTTLNGTVLSSSLTSLGTLGSLTVSGKSTLANVSSTALSASGALVFSNYGTGLLHSTSAGVITSSAVTLSGADVSGVLPIANGGTNNSAAYTSGSIPFSNGTSLTQNNANLFWDNTNLQLQVGSTTGFSATTNTPLSIGGSINNYLEVYLQNKMASTTASSDFIAGADNDGTANIGHYADFGTNSSLNANPSFTGLGANEGYAYSSGGSMDIGTDATTSASGIKFLTGGLATANVRMRIDNNGNVGIGTGTANPSSTLHVIGTFITTGKSTLAAASTTALSASGNVWLTNTLCASGNFLTSDATTGLVSCGTPAGSGTLTGNSTSTYLAFYTGATALTGNSGLTFATSTALLTTPSTTVTGAFKVSSISGSTQCIHVDTTGLFSGTGSDCGSGGGGTPGGSTTQIQVNQNGAFAGYSGFTYASGTQILSFVNASSTNLTASGFLNSATLNVSGAAILSSTLNVTGKTTLAIASTTALTASGDINGGSNLLIAGNGTITGTLGVTGKTTLANVSSTAITATGALVFSNYSTGLLHSSSGGVITSSAVNLAGADITGLLPAANVGLASGSTTQLLVNQNGAIASYSGLTFSSSTLVATIGAGAAGNSTIQFTDTGTAANNTRYSIGNDYNDLGKFKISASSTLGTNDIFVASSTWVSIATSTAAGANASLYVGGHQEYGGSVPSISSCGSSPAIVGNDNTGIITVGSGTVTACTMTFAKTWTNTAICTEMDDSTALTPDITSVSSSSITFGFSATIGSGHIYYQCSSYK